MQLLFCLETVGTGGDQLDINVLGRRGEGDLQAADCLLHPLTEADLWLVLSNKLHSILIIKYEIFFIYILLNIFYYIHCTVVGIANCIKIKSS